MIEHFNISLKIIFTNIFIFTILLFLFYKNYINRKIVLFSICWFFIFLLPTFCLREYVWLPHRLTISMLSFIIIVYLIVDLILKKYNNNFINNVIKIVFIITFLCYTLVSYTESNKYKTTDIMWLNAFMDDSNCIFAQEGMSNIYMKNNNFTEAEKIKIKILNKKGTYRYILSYANLLLCKGDIDQAEYAYLQLEKDLKGEHFRAYLPLSEIYYRKENYNKALEYIQKAYLENQYDTDIIIQMAKIYEKTNNIQRALTMYKDLLKIDKNNDSYKYKISVLEKLTK